MKIYGDYHTHTDHSDGHENVDQMVAAAASKGLQEIAITDHGHGKYMNRLKRNKYAHVRALVEKASKDHNIKTFFGVEANVIGIDGYIDVQTEDRKDIDILLCGIHRGVRVGIRTFFTWLLPNWICSIVRYTPKWLRRRNTEVMKRVIERNDVDIWAHPGRYFKLNVVEVAKTCVERGTVIELNGSRISFRPIDFERMQALGAKFIINSDAHHSKRVGAVDRVFEFLKSCEWSESDIVNLNTPFNRPPSMSIEQAMEKTMEEAVDVREIAKQHKQENKAMKAEQKEKLKREKILKKKK